MPPRKNAAKSDSDASARRSTRIAALPKVEAAVKKVAKPRAKKGAAKTQANTEAKEKTTVTANTTDEPVIDKQDNAKKRDASEMDGQDSEELAPASKKVKPVSKASSKPTSKTAAGKPASRASSKKPASKVGGVTGETRAKAPETITEED